MAQVNFTEGSAPSTPSTGDVALYATTDGNLYAKDDTGKISGLSIGSAKAWVNFNGTGTPAIRDSYNVTSITDNGTGLYTINITTALPNANYAVSCVAMRSASNNTYGSLRATASPKTTTTILVECLNFSVANVDPDFFDVAAFAD